MSFVKLNAGNFSTNSTVFHPKRTFVSSSQGVTGAIKVIVNRSETQKDSIDLREGIDGFDRVQIFSRTDHYEGRREEIFENLATELSAAKEAGADNYSPYADPPRTATSPGTGDFELGILLDGTGLHKGQIPEYDKYNHLGGVFVVPTGDAQTGYSDIEMHPRNSTEMLIRCLKPGSSFYTSGSRALQIAERHLQNFYSVGNAKLGSKFTNYNCFNFFPTDYKSAVLYPNKNNIYSYNSTDSFTLEFYAKVNHNTGSNTILHLPGNFAVSIISGSELDSNGFPTSYALMTQHGTQAELNNGALRPDAFAAFNADHVRASSYVIKPEHWHHCAIRYDGNFKVLEHIVDGKTTGTFQISSAFSNNSESDPLVLGAFYSGDRTNLHRMSGSWNQNTGDEIRANKNKSYTDTGFNNIADVNIHEIRMWNKYIPKTQIISGSKLGYTGSAAELQNIGLKFYVPVLYDADRIRNTTMLVNGDTDSFTIATGSVESEAMILSGTQAQIAPYEAYDFNASIGGLDSSITSLADIFNERADPFEKVYRTPYNTNHANIGGFANVNIQNYAKDFVNTVFPMMHNMSESLSEGAFTQAQVTSSFASIKQHQKRNAFILPCDNGHFTPGFNVLTNVTGTIYIDGGGETVNTKDIANLDDLFDSKLFFVDEVFSVNDSFISPGVGSTIDQQLDERYNSAIETISVSSLDDIPESDLPSAHLQVPSSNIIRTFFDSSDFVGNLVNVITVPQLFYGDRIKAESFKLRAYLHDDDKSEIVLCDDGNGSLYRHQSSGSIATWNTVGDIYYNEGLIYIRNPSLYGIADRNLDITFEGVNTVHAHEINVLADTGLVNSSSNPNYNKLKPSSNAGERSDEFVYISTVYLHDDNLNVVGKAKLAQPILKRSTNKFLFRLRIDF